MNEKKTATELEQMILKEVGDLPGCQVLAWISIVPIGTTWRVDMCGGDPARQAECMDAINSLVSQASWYARWPRSSEDGVRQIGTAKA